MNKWIRRTAGTVGIAGGALLLGTAAHAESPVIADPQALHDLTDSASLDGGLSGVGVSVDTPGQRDTVGLLPDSGGPIRSGTNNGELGAVVHAPAQNGQPRDVFANGRTPDIFQALPITDVVPADGLGMPRTLPTQEASGIPVRNLPIGTSMAGDTLRGSSLGGPLGGSSLGGPSSGGSSLGGPSLGGDDLAHDGFAGNGLGIPLGNQLPLGTAQNLASQGQSAGGQALGGQGLGGQSLGGLPLLGGASAPAGGRAGTTPTAQSSRSQGSSVLAGDAAHVLPSSASESFGFVGFGGRHRTEAGLPTAGGLPVVGDVMKGGTLPTRANVNTLPGAPALPVHDLLAPGTAAAGASSGNALNQATGTVGNLAGPAAGGGTEALPISDEALPVVGGLTGPTGTRGMPLPSTSGIPVVGGIADGLTGGKHRAQYTPRHSA